MIEVWVREKDGRYFSDIFFGYGVLGECRDTLESAFISIWYEVFSQYCKYPEDTFPLVFRDFDIFQKFTQFLIKREGSDRYERFRRKIVCDPGSWKMAPEYMRFEVEMERKRELAKTAKSGSRGKREARKKLSP